MKRIVCLFLTAALTILCLPISAQAAAETVASGTCGENVTWTLYDDGELVISGEGYMDDSPSWLDNYQSFISTVRIQPGGINIGENASFGCSNLQSVSIPDSVTYIEDSAFEHCEKLQTIIIPESVVRIGNNAFGWCTSLQDIVIPPDVSDIKLGAFSNYTTVRLFVFINRTLLQCRIRAAAKRRRRRTRPHQYPPRNCGVWVLWEANTPAGGGWFPVTGLFLWKRCLFMVISGELFAKKNGMCYYKKVAEPEGF